MESRIRVERWFPTQSVIVPSGEFAAASRESVLCELADARVVWRMVTETAPGLNRRWN